MEIVSRVGQSQQHNIPGQMGLISSLSHDSDALAPPLPSLPLPLLPSLPRPLPLLSLRHSLHPILYVSPLPKPPWSMSCLGRSNTPSPHPSPLKKKSITSIFLLFFSPQLSHLPRHPLYSQGKSRGRRNTRWKNQTGLRGERQGGIILAQYLRHERKRGM